MHRLNECGAVVAATRLVLERVKPLAVFDLPFPSGPAVSPVDSLRPVVWRLEVSISITGKQRHADWHNGWMSHVRPTLPGGTWDDEAFVEEPPSESIQHCRSSQGRGSDFTTSSFSRR